MGRLLALFATTLPFLACAPPVKLRLLTQIPKEHVLFLQERLKPFEKENRVKVEITTYRDPSEIEQWLSKGDSTPDLVDLPSESFLPLQHTGALSALDALLKKEDEAKWQHDFFLSDLSRVGGKRFLLPHFIETRILVYSKSRVVDAASKWVLQKEEINTVLRHYNGSGLPIDYQLEDDPGKWDFYDLFVAGWYWKSHESLGFRRGRLACPGIEGSEATLALWDLGLRFGADSVSLAQMTGKEVHQLFQWQGALVREGLCHSATLPNGTGNSLLELFRAGEIFVAETYPRMAWRIHGNGGVGLNGVLSEPSDLGFSPLPKGENPLMPSQANGTQEKNSTAGVATRIWWLAIPMRGKSKDLALKLAEQLIETKFQIDECAGFGLIPARKDLLTDLSLLYGDDWMVEGFQAAIKQMLMNRSTLGPRKSEYSKISQLYFEAYQQMVSGRRASTSEEIGQLLEQTFSPRAREILKLPGPGSLSESNSSAANPIR